MEENLFEGVQWELIHIKDSTPMFEYGYMLKCFCFYQVECNHICPKLSVNNEGTVQKSVKVQLDVKEFYGNNFLLSKQCNFITDILTSVKILVL